MQQRPLSPAEAPKPGDIRISAGRTSHRTTLEVWCGDLLGWVPLRGVVQATWSVDATAREPRLNRLTLVLEPLMARYYDSLTASEAVALRMVGVDGAMLAAARWWYRIAEMTRRQKMVAFCAGAALVLTLKWLIDG